MNTRERAHALAEAAKEIPELQPLSADDLTELVRCELGHVEILDGFSPYSGRQLAWARPRATLLHILPGNTPVAALQSVTLGLLLGSHNLLKFPRNGLPEVERFLENLPAELQAKVEISVLLKDGWMDRAEAVLVYGTDETVAQVRKKIRPDQVFVGHGYGLSFGVVLEDPGFHSVEMAAVDICRFDQKGCLSPHDIYVEELHPGQARDYAGRLAAALEELAKTMPHGPMTLAEQAEVRQFRGSYEFRQTGDSSVQVWSSTDSLDWTVIFEEESQFAVSCLNRVVFVKPIPDDWSEALCWVAPHISAVGLWPCDTSQLAKLQYVPAHRFCPLGEMQRPPWTWHQDGRPRLAELVEWIDFEM